jgi:membrane-bound lytic murein transglycosylase D
MVRPMKKRCSMALWVVAWGVVSAQEEMPLIDDLVREGTQWMQENLDEDVLRSLGEVDQEKVRQLFQELQKRLQGEHVVDLAGLKDSAAAVVPLLEASSETRPYAAWLRSRMDYFEVVDQLRRSTPSPKVEPVQPAKPMSNPGPDLERKVWQKQLEKRPAPSNARSLAARLKPVFVANKVPPELVWLAEVESAFDPAARSPVGAAGLFQLMPQTARSLGLALRPLDDRLDPERSAAGAAKYLRYLHGQFKDWRLALAAYNAGEGHVRQVLNRSKARTFDQIATRLPAETQMYVPKIEATLRKREGIKLTDLPAPK